MFVGVVLYIHTSLTHVGVMLQILNEGEFAHVGFQPEWNSDPQLMGKY